MGDIVYFRCCARNENNEPCGHYGEMDRKEAEKSDRSDNFFIKCKKCNKGNIVTHRSGDWLECCAFTGVGWDDPTGYITSGGIPLYVDIDGHTFTRSEFIEKYKKDPLKYILKKISFNKF